MITRTPAPMYMPNLPWVTQVSWPTGCTAWTALSNSRQNLVGCDCHDPRTVQSSAAYAFVRCLAARREAGARLGAGVRRF